VDLSFSSLPYAMFLSISRTIITYVVCLITSLAVGYWAAHSKLAEKIIIPLIDIGQSIPVLAFLPGVSVFFLALFPESRVGLEMGAIVTLDVGMAWNLMLSFYNSIKTIPREYVDIIRAYGYGRLGILLRLELPYAMNGLLQSRGPRLLYGDRLRAREFLSPGGWRARDAPCAHFGR
jgi:NitT/TauT family transport system permease protein